MGIHLVCTESQPFPAKQSLRISQMSEVKPCGLAIRTHVPAVFLARWENSSKILDRMVCTWLNTE